ncbi:MAG: thiamine diphosphokinase [Bacillota bacterium]|jgi:thiamine pyrophosphokinase
MASQKANKNVADALVIAAGSGFCRDVSRLPLGDSGRVICADGGVEACRALGLSPHILTGDLDSASDSLIEWVRDCGACVRRYPTDKDRTDMELALDEAIALGSRVITVTGVTGGRIDHTLANIDLCLCYAGRGANLTAVEEWGEMFFLAGPVRTVSMSGSVGDIVSLIPRCGNARAVRTSGLYYSLDGEDLQYGASRGVSNYMSGPVARVRIDEGELLVVHTRADGR